MKKGQQIARSIDAKLGNTKGHARLIEAPEFTYVELGFTPQGKSKLDEIQVAYSAEYFEGMNTPEITVSRARRILKDVRISLGLETEDEG